MNYIPKTNKFNIKSLMAKKANKVINKGMYDTYTTYSSDYMIGNIYNYKPKTKKELEDLIAKLIKERGYNADLNDIDTSLITDMALLFCDSDFNGDISKWDVSSVKVMSYMFANSKFNGDISNWDVSKVECFNYMFRQSNFNGDISKWKVNTVFMRDMFDESLLQNNHPKWYID